MRIYLSILLSVVTAVASAQSGFYGKKNVVDISFLGRVPFFNNHNAHNTSLLSTGLHFGYSGALKNNKISIGVELDYQFNTFASDKYLSGYRFDTVARTFNDAIHYNSTSVLFRLEIHEGNFAPFGISHQLAIGPTFNKIVEKDYKHQDLPYDMYYSYYGYVNGTGPKGKMVDATIMYTINTRTAITKSLWLNFGIRSSMHVSTLTNLISLIDPNHGNAQEAMAQAQLRNVFSLKLGLSYAF